METRLARFLSDAAITLLLVAAALLAFSQFRGAEVVVGNLVLRSQGASAYPLAAPATAAFAAPRPSDLLVGVDEPLPRNVIIMIGDGMGVGVVSAAIKTKSANSISKLELDLELKQDAVFELWVTRGGTRLAKPFVLESGRKQGTTDVASTLGVFKCAATSASDSGPDSGPSDNCRWSLDLDVNTIGDGFDLVATNGEGSAEGGGDFGISAYVSNTLIYLTDAIVGALGCQTGNADKSAFTPAIVNPVNGATCQVTRIDTGSIGGPACASNVGYVMRELPEDVGKGCEILKSSGEQLAAILDVPFPEEAWQGLPDADASSPYYGKPVPTRTWVTFGTSPTKYYPDRCIGTLVTDRTPTAAGASSATTAA